MRIEESIDIAATAEDVWTIVGDGFADISTWASATNRSRATSDRAQTIPSAARSGEAPCTGRTCTVATPGFDGIVEQLTAYDEQRRRLSYRAASGMPTRVTEAHSTWTVDDVGAGRCRVSIVAELHVSGVTRYGAPALSLMLRRLGRTTLDDLRHYAEHRRPSPRKLRAARAAGDTDALTHVVRANVVFSGSTGLLMAAGAGMWDAQLGGVGKLPLVALGFGLLGFGTVVARLGWGHASPTLGRVLAVLDAGWLAGSAALLFTSAARFTTVGTVAVLSTSAAVAAFAVLEWRAADSGGDANTVRVRAGR